MGDAGGVASVIDDAAAVASGQRLSEILLGKLVPLFAMNVASLATQITHAETLFTTDSAIC